MQGSKPEHASHAGEVVGEAGAALVEGAGDFAATELTKGVIDKVAPAADAGEAALGVAEAAVESAGTVVGSAIEFLGELLSGLS